MNERSLAIAIAAILYLVTGLGYSIGTAPIAIYLIRNQSLPTFVGITFYAGGFLERWGIKWVIGASLTFILLGVIFVFAAYLLWHSKWIGGIAAIVLFPVAFFISLGSLAPIPITVEPVKLLLVLVGWNTLR